MPTKTIMTNVISSLYKYPSVSDISFITTTTGTSSSSETYTEPNANITIHSHPEFITQDKGITFTATFAEFHPEWNCKPDGLRYFNSFLVSTEPCIVNIDAIVPKKVIEVTIFDGATHIYKQVCREPDEFDLTFALALAWTKYKNEVFNLDYTLEGVEDVAHEYMWKYKKPLKEFNRAIKAYNKWFKEKTRKEVEEEERQAIIERRRAKNKKRKEKMKTRKKQEEISTIAEAIKKARE